MLTYQIGGFRQSIVRTADKPAALALSRGDAKSLGQVRRRHVGRFSIEPDAGLLQRSRDQRNAAVTAVGHGEAIAKRNGGGEEQKIAQAVLLLEAGSRELDGCLAPGVRQVKPNIVVVAVAVLPYVADDHAARVDFHHLASVADD